MSDASDAARASAVLDGVTPLRAPARAPAPGLASSISSWASGVTTAGTALASNAAAAVKDAGTALASNAAAAVKDAAAAGRTIARDAATHAQVTSNAAAASATAAAAAVSAAAASASAQASAAATAAAATVGVRSAAAAPAEEDAPESAADPLESALQDALDAATRHATTGDLALLLARKRNLVAQRLLYGAAGVVAAATFVMSGGASGVLLTGALLAARAVAGRFKGPNGEAFHLRLVCAADPAVPAAERTTLLFATGFRTEDGAGARAGAGAAAKREADEHFRKQLRGILDVVDLSRVTIIKVVWESGSKAETSGVKGLVKAVKGLGVVDNAFSRASSIAKETARFLGPAIAELALGGLASPAAASGAGAQPADSGAGAADAALQRLVAGTRIVLLGHSLGARLALHALERLAALGFHDGSCFKAYEAEGDGRRPAGALVHTAVLLAAATGGPEDKPAAWARAASAVSGSIINCFNSEDAVLNLGLHVAAKLALTGISNKLPPAGSREIDLSLFALAPKGRVVNVNGTESARGHKFAVGELFGRRGRLEGVLPLPPPDEAELEQQADAADAAARAEGRRRGALIWTRAKAIDRLIRRVREADDAEAVEEDDAEGAAAAPAGGGAEGAEGASPAAAAAAPQQPQSELPPPSALPPPSSPEPPPPVTPAPALLFPKPTKPRPAATSTPSSPADELASAPPPPAPAPTPAPASAPASASPPTPAPTPDPSPAPAPAPAPEP